MSYGKLNQPFTLFRVEHGKDPEGFPTARDIALYSGRCYLEPRHGTKVWANRAAFSKADALLRFRVIPGVDVTASHFISCGGARYHILSVENLRKMYWEVLAVKMEGSVS